MSTTISTFPLTSTTLIEGMGGFTIPLTVTLTSSDVTRNIQVSTDGGLTYIDHPISLTSATTLVANISTYITNVKVTGVPGDSLSMLNGANTFGSGVVVDDSPAYPDVIIGLEARPLASVFGKGTVTIIGDGYKIVSTSDGISWGSVGSSDSIADRPSAVLFGKGTWQVGSILSRTDGIQDWDSSSGYRDTPVNVAYFGDSTANIGDYTSPANYDCSIFDAAFPVSGVANVLISPIRNNITRKYPMAKIIANCGVSGDTLTQMLARDSAIDSITRRAATDLIDVSADIIILRAGINSLTSISAGGVTQAEMDVIYADWVTELNRLISVGCAVLAEGIAGYGDNPPATQQVADAQAGLTALNSRFKDYIDVLNNPSIKFLSPVGITCDATGAYLPLMSYDGTHIGHKGSDVLGDAEKLIFDSLFGKSKRTRYPGVNLATNPLMVTTTSETYGTNATGYSITPVNPSLVTLQNAKVELINGIIMQTAEYVPTGTGAVTTQMKAPLTVEQLGTVLSGDVYGFEFDYYLKMLDQTRVIASSDTVGCIFSITKTANGRIQANVDYSSVSVSSLNEFSGHAVFNPIKINEVSANLTLPVLYFTIISTAANSIAANAFKMGIGGVRIVKLT